LEIKDWGKNPRQYSLENLLGQHVPERYLDDRDDLKGTRLKILSRLGALPVMRRVGKEQKPPWPRAMWSTLWGVIVIYGECPVKACCSPELSCEYVVLHENIGCG
jgi:hypothetical protein